MNRDSRGSETLRVLSYDGERVVEDDERIIREIPLEVHLNGRRVITIACTGMHVEELAVGFLASEGVLRSRADLSALEVSDDGREVRIRTSEVEGRPEPPVAPGRTVASSGARGMGLAPEAESVEAVPAGVRVSPGQIQDLMRRFLELASLHDETGGTHAAALVREGDILAVRQDIGRHNTIDMLGGYALLNGQNCRGAMILRTGRVSSEIVHKVRLLGVSLVASLSVPTTLAVQMAREAGITLVGSVRGGRMKIYSHEGRLTI